MKAILPRTHLVRLLHLVERAAASESTAPLPLMTRVRVAACPDGQLGAAAMSLYVAALAAVEAQIEEPGVAAMSLRRCLDAARTLVGTEVALSRVAGRLLLVGDDGL